MFGKASIQLQTKPVQKRTSQKWFSVSIENSQLAPKKVERVGRVNTTWSLPRFKFRCPSQSPFQSFLCAKGPIHRRYESARLIHCGCSGT